MTIRFYFWGGGGGGVGGKHLYGAKFMLTVSHNGNNPVFNNI